MKNNKLSLFLRSRQSEIALITTFGMVFGFLCGRAILSISMFLFCINTLWDIKPKELLTQKWWLWGLAWTGLYAISYFWSTDLPYWGERVQVKLPYLLFPLAFGFLRPLSEKNIRYLTYGMILLVLGGCIYSLSFYFANTEAILNGYSYSQVLTTPAYKDHIRYSIFVAWLVIWCCYVFRKMNTRIDKTLIILAIGFFTLYLHILAVRSGLLVLYSFAFLYLIYLFLRKKLLAAFLILFGIGAALFTAYNTAPSFKSKIHYVIYSYDQYESGNISANFSDIGRIISYDLAAKIIVEHPYLGVGAGDIRAEMKKKYERYSPDTKPEQRIVPHNQIMEVTLAGGIVTLIVFLVWLFFPLRGIKRNRNGFYVFATWFALFVSMMVEPMLEVQFGVFVYLFCLLWIQKAVQSETSIPEAVPL